jgi:hypothetical protein
MQQIRGKSEGRVLTSGNDDHHRVRPVPDWLPTAGGAVPAERRAVAARVLAAIEDAVFSGAGKASEADQRIALPARAARLLGDG